MKYRFAKVCLLVVFLFTAAAAMAQDDNNIVFKANIPNVVAVGEIFNIEFTSNVSGSFSPPEFSENVEVLAGPQSSVSNHISIINGSFTQEPKYTVTYVLRSNNEGEFTVGASTWNVKGKDYSSKPVTVRVIRERNGGSANQNNGEGQQRSSTQSASSIQKDDIIFVPFIDKKNVYKGEAIRVTYKLYTTIGCNLTDAKTPSFNGFWSQQLDVSNYANQREEYNGRLYNAYVIYETLLFPQQIGELTIDKFDITAVVQIIKESTQGRNPFEDLLAGPEIQEERIRLSASPLKVTVKDFPAGAPASFSGAVGEFELTSEPLPADITANSAITYKIKLSGRGNLPQIQAPQLVLPSSFEQYNVTTTGSINNSASGVSGYRQFEYPIITRAEGDFVIGEMEFTYLNPRTSSYVTLKIPEVAVHVKADASGDSVRSGGGLIGGLSKENVKVLGSDIRFIKTGSSNLCRRSNALMPAGLYILLMLIIIAFFVFMLFFLRKKLQEMRNNALMRGRKANKAALQRLRAAEQHMRQENQRGFYEEMLKALWGYMSDKLNIPVANLTKDNIRIELVKKGIDEGLASHYVEIIEGCEYAQYAPSVYGKMNDIYVSGVEVITELESILGK